MIRRGISEANRILRYEMIWGYLREISGGDPWPEIWKMKGSESEEGGQGVLGREKQGLKATCVKGPGFWTPVEWVSCQGLTSLGNSQRGPASSTRGAPKAQGNSVQPCGGHWDIRHSKDHPDPEPWNLCCDVLQCLCNDTCLHMGFHCHDFSFLLPSCWLLHAMACPY
jgi:hypothetical protein